MTHDPQAEYWTVRQVAARFGVTKKTVRKWIAGGWLEAYRAGPKLWKITRESEARLAQKVPPFDR